METFLIEIESFCASAGIKPQRLLRDAVGASWGQWAGWKSGRSSPTMALADRVRVHIANNPPETYRDRNRTVAA